MSFNHISAIGFDLFNTLIFADPETLSEAMGRLVGTLQSSGLHFDEPSFNKAYRSSALQFIEKTRLDGKETHNRFWISEALGRVGQAVAPDDPRIAATVDATGEAEGARAAATAAAAAGWSGARACCPCSRCCL